jgi:DNA-binding beta-propeller fold protein YncE
MAALALALPLLVISGPAHAQRKAPAAAAASGLGRAYVTDPFGATVTVIDTRTLEIVTAIPVDFAAFDADHPAR